MRPVDTENGFHAKIRILSESVSCRRKIRGGGPKRTTPSPRCGRGRFAEAEACLCGSGRMRLRRYRNGCFPYGGFGLRCRLQLFGSAMPVAVGRGCHAVLFAEEFDEVRGVGKGACGADFGDRLVGRDQKQPGMDQALPDEPLVGRGPVDAEKFLFERSQGAVAAFCDLLDRNIGKDVGIDDLLEVVPGRIDVAQQLAFVMQQSPCETIR